MKACKKCGVVKPLEDFYRAEGTRDGRRGDCAECFKANQNARNAANPERNRQRVREWEKANPERVNERHRERRKKPAVKRSDRGGHLKRKFGMTLDDFDQMMERQGGVCRICDGPPPEGVHLHVDHDPRTGVVRALLCVRCNNALGQFKEDRELLLKAVEYLDRHNVLTRLKLVQRELAGVTSGTGRRERSEG